MDSRWKFDTNLDVDPYACRSSCSIYRSGVIQVNMNTSLMTKTPGFLEVCLPEVHSEYVFLNTPDGYNFTRGGYLASVYYNKTKGSDVFWAYGFLIVVVEEYTQGTFELIEDKFTNKIGDKYINRIWTLMVPETIKFPYNPDNKTFEIISVPISVKAYTCEVEFVQEVERGSYNLFGQNLRSTISEFISFIERKWKLAIMRGEDTSVYEITPEHWASFLTVKDIQTATIEDVPVQMDMSCISVHPTYILLMCIYTIMLIIGGICGLITYKSKLKIPSGVIGWARHSCKESNKESTNNEDVEQDKQDLFSYKLIASDKKNHTKIIRK